MGSANWDAYRADGALHSSAVHTGLWVSSWTGRVQDSLVCIHFSFFSVTGWGIDLDYCDIEWFALKMNRDHSVVFEIA